MDSKIKILLVDDEKRFRDTTARILERRGFEVLLAGDGPEALAKLGQKPEVVILDIKMPGMDGLEVLGKIRAQDRQLPVIMLTGHGSEMAAQEALKQGAFDFLAKPCDIDVLSQKVNEACKASHPPGEHPESRVAEVMVPLEEYTTVSPQATVAETMIKMRESFFAKAATDSIMETGHRSVLVTDNGGKVRGILAILDLLKAIMPSYLSAPKPTLADSIVYSPMFWAGLFTRSIRELGPKKISEIMSPAPPVISLDATLMTAAYEMVRTGERRLCVISKDKVVGVIREQDLFFAMERILRG